MKVLECARQIISIINQPPCGLVETSTYEMAIHIMSIDKGNKLIVHSNCKTKATNYLASSLLEKRLLYFYNPNISLTMRSEPRTRPVRISILNTIWPTYCQTMVAAPRVASAAGVLLERNAE